MKTPGGNIGKINTTEDKIVRVDATESELDGNPVQQVLGVNELLPQLSILQLSDVGLKTKKTFKGKAGKALVVGADERSIEFGEGGGGGMPNTIPFILTYANNVDVDLSKSLNYILTLTGDCNFTFGQQPGHQGFSNGYTYNIILIQDAYGGHTINLPSGFLYADGYSQDTTAGGVSILTIKFDNGMCFASICKYSPLSVAGPRLAFTANTPGSTVTLDNASNSVISGLRYSFDGITRNAYSNGYTITLTNLGDKVLFKNIGEGDGAASSGQFSMTGSISCSGDVTYLINKNGGDIALLYPSTFANLFDGCTSLVTPPSLPSTTVGSSCYKAMFRNCTSLIIAPELPATNIGNACYQIMFAGCTNLTTAPILPATTVADSCYEGMFSGCTALTTAPALPAITMEYCCYYFMFSGCTSLTTAPELPATTLDTMCYTQMFQSCTSLTTIPALPASTLVSLCYSGMFMNCTNIKLSETQTGEYQTPYRIPPSVQGTQGTDPTMGMMFSNTGGTFTGTPTINTRYYTSNTIV